MATIYSIDPSFLNISDVEIPPYQVMAKMDNLEIQRKDLAQEVPLCTYFLKLDIEGELLDAKLHDGLFENNPDTKLQWVRPSDIKDRMNFEQSMQLKKETKGFLNSFFKKKKGLSLSLKPLIEPATRDEFLKKITSADLPYNFTKSLVFKALTIEPGYHSVTKVLLNRLKGIEELKEVKPLSSKTRMANYPSLKGFTEEKTALMAEEKTSVVNENDAVDTINHIHNLRECVLRLKKEESKGTLLEEWKENDGEILLENSLKTMLHNNNKNQAYCDSGLKNHLEYFKVMLSDLDELSHIPLEDKEEYRENLSEASESLREIILFQEKLKESNALVVIQKNKDWIMNAPGTTQSESDLSLEDDISAGVIQSDLEVSIEHSSEDKEESFEHKM
ncbi:MAG: hypothetical protein HRT88_00745 [Lentisphaeraceae bacterium]|nr:hypothetical protein [Lentisphaeraceae bacterium]